MQIQMIQNYDCQIFCCNRYWRRWLKKDGAGRFRDFYSFFNYEKLRSVSQTWKASSAYCYNFYAPNTS